MPQFKTVRLTSPRVSFYLFVATPPAGGIATKSLEGNKVRQASPQCYAAIRQEKNMFDVAIRLENRPGAMAEMGEALGAAGVSVEGGGGWVADGKATMHFLFMDGEAAKNALEAVGIEVLDVHEVLVQKLRQDVPGQLGNIARKMAEAGVNIEVIYSDHDNQLILVVDDFEKGKMVSDAWQTEMWPEAI